VLLLQSEVAASEHEGSELTAVKSQVLQMLLKLGIAPARGEHRLAGRWRHVQADLQSIGSVVDKVRTRDKMDARLLLLLLLHARDSARSFDTLACTGLSNSPGQTRTSAF